MRGGKPGKLFLSRSIIYALKKAGYPMGFGEAHPCLHQLFERSPAQTNPSRQTPAADNFFLPAISHLRNLFPHRLVIDEFEVEWIFLLDGVLSTVVRGV